MERMQERNGGPGADRVRNPAAQFVAAGRKHLWFPSNGNRQIETMSEHPRQSFEHILDLVPRSAPPKPLPMRRAQSSAMAISW